MNSTSFPVSTPITFDEPITDDQKAKAKQAKHVHRFFKGIQKQIEDFQSPEAAQYLSEKHQLILQKVRDEISPLFKSLPEHDSKAISDNSIAKWKSFNEKFEGLEKRLRKLNKRQDRHLNQPLNNPIEYRRSSDSNQFSISIINEKTSDNAEEAIKQDLKLLKNEVKETGFASVYNDSKIKLENFREKILLHDSSPISRDLLDKLIRILKNSINKISILKDIQNSHEIHSGRLKKFNDLKNLINDHKKKHFEINHLIKIIQYKQNLSSINSAISKITESSYKLSRNPYDLSDYNLFYYTSRFDKRFTTKRDLSFDQARLRKHKSSLISKKDNCELSIEIEKLTQSQLQIRTKLEKQINALASHIADLSQTSSTAMNSYILDSYEEEGLNFHRSIEYELDKQVSRSFNDLRELACRELKKIHQELISKYNEYCLEIYQFKFASLLFSKLVNIKVNLCDIYLEAEEIWQELRDTRKKDAIRTIHLSAFQSGKEKLEKLRNQIHSHDIDEIYNTQHIQEVFPEEKCAFVPKGLKCQIEDIDKICLFDFSNIKTKADTAIVAKKIGLVWNQEDENETNAITGLLNEQIDRFKKTLNDRLDNVSKDYSTTQERCEMATYEVNRVGKILNINSDYYDSDFTRAYFKETPSVEMLQQLALSVSNMFFTPITYAPYEDIPSPFEKLPDPVLTEEII